MKEKKFVHNCPICHSSALEEFINTIDYAQSEESFHIQQCTSCKFLMTSPRPDIDDLSQYYKKKDYISHSDSGHGVLNSIYRIVRSFTLKTKTECDQIIPETRCRSGYRKWSWLFCVYMPKGRF